MQNYVEQLSPTLVNNGQKLPGFQYVGYKWTWATQNMFLSLLEARVSLAKCISS